MITASHNPAEDNGLKIVSGRTTIYGDEIQRLRARVDAGPTRQGGQPGRSGEHDILRDYIEYIADNIRLGPRRVKVVVDGGNGTGGVALLPILRKLDVEVEAIYCEPHGHDLHAGSEEHTSELQSPCNLVC